MMYEEIFILASGISAPTEQSHLSIEWVLAGELAVGRDAANRYLLVLAGVELDAKSELVSRVLSHGHWLHESGAAVSGTLLRLHDGEPFLVAVTAIATEFLRRGLGPRSAPEVFREVESFIELVIRRVLLPPNSLLGLIGELLILDYALEGLAGLSASKRPTPSSLWRGYTNQSRDLAFNRLAIEVKTTSGHSSRHHIGSLDQVEPRTLDGGLCESLFLASIGLAEEIGGTSRFSVSQLTDRILSRLSPADCVIFLDQLRQYGPDDCIGYDHGSMSSWEPYSRRYRLTFEPRLYDMSDPNVRVLRRADLQELFVMPEGISYVVDLPSAIPGSHGQNPRTDLASELSQLLEHFG
ncbi:MAG: PD-(D/E)XK motif protein [Myxococcota bacterium]